MMNTFFYILITIVVCTFLFIGLHRYLIGEYTDYIAELKEENDELRDFLVEIQRRATESYQRITEVDRKGSFRSDDEVGFVFNFLRDIVVDVYSYALGSYRKRVESENIRYNDKKTS